MSEVVIGKTHIEYGRITEVSPELFTQMINAKELINSNLKHMFNADKVKDFSTWDGEPDYIQGPDVTHWTIAMKDGSDVPDELFDEYAKNAETGDITLFYLNHFECEPKSYINHQFGYYAVVPMEHLTK